MDAESLARVAAALRSRMHRLTKGRPALDVPCVDCEKPARLRANFMPRTSHTGGHADKRPYCVDCYVRRAMGGG